MCVIGRAVMIQLNNQTRLGRFQMFITITGERARDTPATQGTQLIAREYFLPCCIARIHVENVVLELS